MMKKRFGWESGIFFLALASLFLIVARESLTIAQSQPPAPQFPPELVFHEADQVITLAYTNLLVQTCTALGGTKKVNWIRRERAAPTDQWDKTTATYSTTFRITAAAGRDGGDHCYVAGIDPFGSDVIEHWTFPTPSGRQALRATLEPQPIGVPMPVVPQMSVEILGEEGVYVPPAGSSHVAPDRVQLHTGSYGGIQSLAADPEGRFLLFATLGARTLYRIDILQGPPYVASVLTTLPIGISYLELVAEVDGRRLLVMSGNAPDGWGPGQFLVLPDSDNDGEFDLEMMETYSDSDAFEQAYPEASFVPMTGYGL